MKIISSCRAAVFCLGAVLLLQVGNLRADDDDKTSPHRHKTTHKQRAAAAARADRHPREVQGGVTGGANGPEYRVRTGSHLPEHYNRRGYSTDSHDNETIIDHNDIRLQNSNTPGDALRQVPGVTVGGRP